MSENRIETDSMGDVEVPVEAYYGAQTQRAVNNFSVSGLTMPGSFIRALGLVKQACARANLDLGLLTKQQSEAIVATAQEVANGEYDSHFPVDIFQTGSATSTNMNANEVIARLASERSEQKIHPNDHVNMGQSSNDVIPTTIHVSTVIDCKEKLLPALSHLHDVITIKASSMTDVIKTGRTHLMDAMPVSFSQELSGWAAQIKSGITNIQQSLPAVEKLAIGGTAVGTGINAHKDFARKVTEHLSAETGHSFRVTDNHFLEMSTQDAAVSLSGQLKAIAVNLMKIANDLRWMNSGPLAGIGEITLPALQPGSSIMPGKVNPVIPESVAMVCAKVIGNDSSITIAGQSGNFQLNVMLPLIAHDLLQSIHILAKACESLADKAIVGFVVNMENIKGALSKNPVLITALNPVIGYELGAKIAKKAYAENRAVIDVAAEMTDLSVKELEQILSPHKLTKGGLQDDS